MTKFSSKPTKEWYQYIFSKQHTQTIDNLIHIFIYFSLFISIEKITAIILTSSYSFQNHHPK